MTASGPFPFGEGWDDPDAPGGAGPVDEGSPTEHAAGACGGWIPPEERLWRHPSEVWAGSGGSEAGYAASGSGGEGTGEGASRDPQAAPRSRLSWATAIVGAGAAAALVAGGLLLADTSSGHSANSVPGATHSSQVSSAATAVTALVTGPGAQLPAPARQVERSLVSLEIGTTHGTSTGTAVAVGEGGLIATTADAVAGSVSLTAFTATGKRERAQLVAMDQGSDVALLRVPEDLPVAHFLDHLDSPVGHQAVVVGMLPANGDASGNGKAKVVWSVGTIDSPAATVTAGDANGLAAIAATVPFLPEQPGNVLLKPDGTVLGIFDKSGTPEGTAGGMFLPADLVLGVSNALAGQGQVRHGWLGIEGTNSSTALGEPPGALVTSVDPAGPAVHSLEPGDIIESIDGNAVQSMAQLREELYVLAPDVSVTLGVSRAGSPMAVEVDLGSSF